MNWKVNAGAVLLGICLLFGLAWYSEYQGNKLMNYMSQAEKEKLSGEDKQGVILGKEEKDVGFEMDTTFTTSSMFVPGINMSVPIATTSTNLSDGGKRYYLKVNVEEEEYKVSVEKSLYEHIKIGDNIDVVVGDNMIRTK
ncbi:TPA: hypothetical protein QCX59_003998 [Bacillus mycoides]|uniref:hypothetical protein n=1 Tax=Bacillus sp. K2I17 TaxID=2014743 RepID=UPI000B5167EE|nr:hypothetical protein [Bacillus sp. K2I17]OWT48557.1 hypothetical protein CER22_24920 [Bacillus sp. K2I17]HDR7594804.1 hypothetical protein [Bacillus mycoides]